MTQGEIMEVLRKTKKWLTAKEIAKKLGVTDANTCLRKLRLSRGIKFKVDKNRPFKETMVYSI